MILVSMPREKNKRNYVPKTITIRVDQKEYIEKNSINLSKFVQKKLDEIMIKK